MSISISMSLLPGNNMATCYASLLSEIYDSDVIDINRRTGERIRMLPYPTSFLLDLNDGNLPMPVNRRYFPQVAAAELAWQILGTQDPSFILKYAPKLWSKFVRDDKLETAYGYRWRKHFGRDQLVLAISALSEDETNRQIWVQAWDPSNDGLGGPQPPNIPCPIGFTLSVMDEKVNMALFIRSSDIMLGLPYDVMCYAMLLGTVAAELELAPGYMHVTLAHPHVYGRHEDEMLKSVYAMNRRTDFENGKIPSIELQLPAIKLEDIESNPDDYVAYVKSLALKSNRPKYNPYMEVVE